MSAPVVILFIYLVTFTLRDNRKRKKTNLRGKNTRLKPLKNSVRLHNKSEKSRCADALLYSLGGGVRISNEREDKLAVIQCYKKTNKGCVQCGFHDSCFSNSSHIKRKTEEWWLI